MPDAALARADWPISNDHCFARVILDSVCERPWREVIPSPAWRRMDMATLRAAVDMAEAIADGRRDLVALNRRSLTLRGKSL